MGMVVDGGEGEHLNFSEGVLAHPSDRVIGNGVVEHAHEPLRRRRDAHADANADEFIRQEFEVYPALQNAVDGVADENGNVQRRHHRDDGKEQGEQNEGHRRLQIAQNAAEGALACFFTHISPPP